MDPLRQRTVSVAPTVYLSATLSFTQISERTSFGLAQRSRLESFSPLTLCSRSHLYRTPIWIHLLPTTYVPLYAWRPTSISSVQPEREPRFGEIESIARHPSENTLCERSSSQQHVVPNFLQSTLRLVVPVEERGARHEIGEVDPRGGDIGRVPRQAGEGLVGRCVVSSLGSS